MDDAGREISERDQSTVELEAIIGRRMPSAIGGVGGVGAPPGSEGEPPLPIAVTLLWGLF